MLSKYQTMLLAREELIFTCYEAALEMLDPSDPRSEILLDFLESEYRKAREELANTLKPPVSSGKIALVAA